jgi:hypothetical protein
MMAVHHIKAAYHEARAAYRNCGHPTPPTWETLEPWVRDALFAAYHAGRNSVRSDAEAVERYWYEKG